MRDQGITPYKSRALVTGDYGNHYTMTLTKVAWLLMDDYKFSLFTRDEIRRRFKAAFDAGKVRSWKQWRDIDGTLHLEWRE